MTAAIADPPFARHVLQRTIVLPELRVLFLPVPKAGCTSLLWMLARLAGLPDDAFTQSEQAEVSPELAVHDMQLWPAEHRFSDHAPEARERMQADPAWLRFTVVRNPATRLWSAWQSKLLLREPRFVATFAEAPWFPRVPDTPEQIVEDFRAFVAALGGPDAPSDVHWAPQHELIGQIPLNHVGHVERMRETLDRLREHFGAPALEPPRANPSPLCIPPHAYGEPERAIVRERYAEDYARYGYALAPPAGGSEWERDARGMLAMVRDTIGRNRRVGELHRVARERTRRVEELEARKPPANREGREDFAVRWRHSRGPLASGFTAVVRARDEARTLPWSLPPLLRAVEQVILIDNGSTDGTAAVARQVAADHRASGRLEVLAYPFGVARCGADHLATPVDSVHSLAYFYNWSFSHVATRYALKWDADMVLTDAAVQSLRDLAWQLEGTRMIVRVPRYPLYVASERRAFLDLSLRNCEAWGWPNARGFSFVKAMEWELPLWGGGSNVRAVELPDFGCVELKHLDAEEFAHWSATDFTGSARTQRKRREWEVFQVLAGGAEAPEGVVAIDAPPGRHVIDYVRDHWLARRARDTTLPRSRRAGAGPATASPPARPAPDARPG